MNEKRDGRVHEPDAMIMDASEAIKDAETIESALLKNMLGAEPIPLTEEGFELRFRERPSTEVSIRLPSDVIPSLEQVAVTRDMSVEALVRFYIGQNLRRDLLKLYFGKQLD